LPPDLENRSQIDGTDLSKEGRTQKDQPKRSTSRGSSSKDQSKKINNFKAPKKTNLGTSRKDQKKDQSDKQRPNDQQKDQKKDQFGQKKTN